MHSARYAILMILFAVACTTRSPTPSEPAPATTGEESEPADHEPAQRTSMTAEECEAQGGTVVGDIGDGRTQREDYLCENGQPPIGSVPVGIEGSVCCGS